MDQWQQHTAYCKRWVGTGKRPTLFTRRDNLTWDCWTDPKAGGSMRSGEDCVLPNGQGRQQTPRHERHRIHGSDKLATTKAMNGTKIPPEQRNDPRELLCGCVWTQKRQFDCHRADSLLCLFCGQEPEDEEHILWRCPRWETLRRERQAPSNRDRLKATVHFEMWYLSGGP